MKQLATAVAGLALFLTASSALAHGILLLSQPQNGAALASAPTQIRLQFNEPVEAAFTSVTLVGPGSSEIRADKAHVDKDDLKTAVLLLPALAAGAYRAQWSSMGLDGHRIKGEFAFSVK